MGERGFNLCLGTALRALTIGPRGKPRESLGRATDIVEDMGHRQHSMAHLNEDPSLATAGRFLTLTCGFLALNKRNKLKVSSFYECGMMVLLGRKSNGFS